MSCHREENVDEPNQLGQFVGLLNWLAEEYGQPVIVSTHPRTKMRLQVVNAKLRPEVDLRPPFGFFDYVHLEMCARATLSDSGTVSEESSILGFPALNIRETHERPEAMEEAAVMMVGFDISRVREGLGILANQASAGLCIVRDYEAANISEKVVRIIESYVNYVNLTVWQKPRSQKDDL